MEFIDDQSLSMLTSHCAENTNHYNDDLVFVHAPDGKCLACTYRAKFAEISVGINHNIDDLLVGILSQIRLKVIQSQSASGASGDADHWYKSRGVVRASMKARQMLTWLFGKEDRKFKNCENLHVL